MAAASWVAVLAWMHPLLRLIYIATYLANIPPVRSLLWLVGLFSSAVLAVGLVAFVALLAITGLLWGMGLEPTFTR